MTARYDRLMPAAVICSAAGTATGIASVGVASAIPIVVWSLIWSPPHQGLASAILAASMTVTSIFWWRARRRPRHKTP